jgi:hypothetical protein
VGSAGEAAASGGLVLHCGGMGRSGLEVKRRPAGHQRHRRTNADGCQASFLRHCSASEAVSSLTRWLASTASLRGPLCSFWTVR